MSKSFWSSKVIGFIFIIGLSSCTGPYDPSKDPKKSLSDYISLSFSTKSPDDRSRLLLFLTGDVKTRLEGWSDDQFREAFIESRKEFLKLIYREIKDVSPTEVQITYELTYLDRGRNHDGKSHEAKVTNKKLCQLKFEKNKWLISDVKNIKELVEYTDALSLP